MKIGPLICLLFSALFAQAAIAGLSVNFGGRADLDIARYFEDITPLRSDGELRRLRLDAMGSITDSVSFYALADFSDGSYTAQDAWLRYRFTDRNELYLGRVEVPFSMQRVSNSQYQPFMERALPAALSPHYGTGVVYLHKGEEWTWRVGMFGEDRLDFGGSKESGDLLAVRLGKRIRAGQSRIWLGASAMKQDSLGTERVRSRPESNVTDEYLVNTQRIPGMDETRKLGLEGMWKRDRWVLEGEWIQYTGKRANKGGLSFSGGYVAASRMFNGRRRFNFRKGEWMSPDIDEGGAWEIASRVSWLDLQDAEVSGGKEVNFTLGINYYFNRLNRVMFNWIQVRAEPNSRGMDESPSIVQLRLQLGF